MDRDGNISEFQISPKSTKLVSESFNITKRENSFNKVLGIDKPFSITIDKTKPTERTFGLITENDNFSPRQYI